MTVNKGSFYCTVLTLISEFILKWNSNATFSVRLFDLIFHFNFVFPFLT